MRNVTLQDAPASWLANYLVQGQEICMFRPKRLNNSYSAMIRFLPPNVTCEALRDTNFKNWGFLFFNILEVFKT